MEQAIDDKAKQKMLDKALLSEMGVSKDELKKMKKKLAKAEGKPERGIETWFRLASKNLYARLAIVDRKANILISSNAIIISITLGSLYPRLMEDPHLIFAVGGMVITNVLSIAFAIMAAIPKASSKRRGDKMEATDLMNFENFHVMPLESYKERVKETVADGNSLYDSIILDIHTLGVLLSKKYRLIRISFLVFMYGILLSVMAFAACHAIFSTQPF
ncbi:MAG: Pycsar system effector family protein [Bacteroidia bacterium]